MKAKTSVWLLLLTLIFLTGCSPKIIYKDKYIHPPMNLLAPTEYVSAKEYGVNVYGDLPDYIVYLKGRVGACNADKEASLSHINKYTEVK